jgi:hypothetical protein
MHNIDSEGHIQRMLTVGLYLLGLFKDPECSNKTMHTFKRNYQQTLLIQFYPYKKINVVIAVNQSSSHYIIINDNDSWMVLSVSNFPVAWSANIDSSWQRSSTWKYDCFMLFSIIKPPCDNMTAAHW